MGFDKLTSYNNLLILPLAYRHSPGCGLESTICCILSVCHFTYRPIRDIFYLHTNPIPNPEFLVSLEPATPL